MSRAGAKSNRRPRDAYLTPTALARHLVGLLPLEPGDTALEPHAGGGAFVDALIDRGVDTTGWDIDPSLDWRVQDFLALDAASLPRGWPLWIVGNPPFNEAEAHVRQALDLSVRHVAFLLRLGFAETSKRFPLWQEHPARHLWVLAERPSFGKRLGIRQDRQVTLFRPSRSPRQLSGTGQDSTAYGLFWWDKDHHGPSTWAVTSWR